jgi:hypothetical protein
MHVYQPRRKSYGGIRSTRKGKGRGLRGYEKGDKLEGLTQGNIIMYFPKLLRLGK